MLKKLPVFFWSLLHLLSFFSTVLRVTYTAQFLRKRKGTGQVLMFLFPKPGWLSNCSSWYVPQKLDWDPSFGQSNQVVVEMSLRRLLQQEQVLTKRFSGGISVGFISSNFFRFFMRKSIRILVFCNGFCGLNVLRTVISECFCVKDWLITFSKEKIFKFKIQHDLFLQLSIYVFEKSWYLLVWFVCRHNTISCTSRIIVCFCIHWRIMNSESKDWARSTYWKQHKKEGDYFIYWILKYRSWKVGVCMD